jgi:hypothetical protein
VEAMHSNRQEKSPPALNALLSPPTFIRFENPNYSCVPGNG